MKFPKFNPRKNISLKVCACQKIGFKNNFTKF